MIDYEFGSYLKKELAKASKKVEQLTEAYQETGEPQRGLNRMEYKMQACAGCWQDIGTAFMIGMFRDKVERKLKR